MANAKKTADFDRLTVEDIQQEVASDSAYLSDEIEIATAGSGRSGATFDVKPQHTPSLGAVLATVGQDESAMKTDPRALENMSTDPCIESAVIYTETQKAHIAGASAIQATLDNPKGMMEAKIPIDARRQLAEISEAMKSLPTPDAVTFSDHRKVIIPGEVRDVPNQLSKVQALKLIEAIVGEALTAKVVKCAMGNGFVAKPHLWLSQRLAYEASGRRIWDQIQPLDNYDESQDGNKEAVIPKALTKLFSDEVTDKFMSIASARRISLLHCTKIMIERVCEKAIQEKAPKEFTEKYDSMSGLEELMASG